MDPEAAAALADEAAGVARSFGRGDLGARLAQAAARSSRTVRVVCVVGEHNQGKSSLVNALVGRTICPVDDDVTTAVVTVLHHADELQVVAHRPGAAAEEVAVGRLPDLLTERGNPDNTLGLARIDVGFPNPLLATGLTIVDTPGAGGPGAGAAAAVLGFLPFADAFVFVRDIDSPLGPAEVDLLRRAQDRKVAVVVCLTKSDLHPRRAQAADAARRLLHEADIRASVVTVSSTLREQALRRADHELDVSSGFPKLIEILDWEVRHDAATRATDRLVRETQTVLGQLDAIARAEAEVLVDTTAIAGLAGELDRAGMCLGRLSGPDGRWVGALDDGIGDVAALTAGALRVRLNAVRRSAEEQIQAGSTPAELLEAMLRAQDDVAEVVADTLAMLDGRVVGLATGLSNLVGEAMLALDAVPAGRIDVRPALRLDPPVAARARDLPSAIPFLAGTDGVMTLGTLSLLLPAATGAVLADGPVVLGTGLLMGRRRAAERERVAAEQREAARDALRQLVDDVQLQLGTHIAEALRIVHQSLARQIAARIDELARTHAQLHAALDAALGTDAVGRRRRRAALEVVRARIEECLAAADALR